MFKQFQFRPQATCSRLTTILFALSITLPSSAATPFSRPAGAAETIEVSAGYIALFTCSAHFIMRRPLKDIMRIELVDIAPYQPPWPEIDTQRQLVRATDHDGNVAIAAYRDTMGCTVLPPHWTEADVVRLPYVAFPPRPDVAALQFPKGDKANPKMNRRQRALMDQAFDGTSFGEKTVTLATVIIKAGKIVAEQYRPGFGVHTGYRTWSTAKSIAATLVGIASHASLINIDEPLGIPEWQYFNDPRQQITWRHLLNMSSGLQSAGAGTGAIYFGGQDAVSAITTTPLVAEPNTVWQYANGDTLLLLYGLRHALGDDLRYLRYPYEELFLRIGMYDSRYETDHLGNFIGSSQMYTTARDLGRFGLLYLQKGVWNGEQILPEGWTELVTTAAPALVREDGKQGYGGQFWLLDRLPGVPEGTYTTSGNKGQLTTIIPSENMVIVRTGVDPNGVRWQQDKFIAAVLEAF